MLLCGACLNHTLAQVEQPVDHDTLRRNGARFSDEYPDEPDPNVYCSRCGCVQHPAEIMDLNCAPACESCVEAVAGPLSGAWGVVPF
jgi:hypothetical protein